MAVILAALVLEAAAWVGGIWIGWVLVGRPRGPAAGGEDHDPIVLGWIGWYVQALLVLLVGMAGCLEPWWLGALLVLPVVGAAADRQRFFAWWREGWQEYLALFREAGWMLLPAALALLWVGFQLTVPVFFYDTLLYGFGLPAHWLAEGRIHTAAADNFAYLAIPPRMHFLWALGLVGEPLPSLDLVAALVAATLVIGRVLARSLRLPARWCALAMTGLAVTPALWELVLLRKDDLYAVTGAAMLVAVVLEWGRHPTTSWRRAVVLALAAAIAVAVKQPHTLGFAACGWVVAWWSDPGRLTSRWWRSLARGSLLAVLVVVPLFVYVWVDSGHPATGVAPYLGDREIVSARWARTYNDAEPFWAERHGTLGQDLVFNLVRFYRPQHWKTAGNLGALILVLIPVAVVFGRRRALVLWWLGGLAGWYLTLRLPRFASILVPLAVVLIFDLLVRMAHLRWVTVLVLAAALVNLALYLGHPVTGAVIGNHGWPGWHVTTNLVLLPPSLEVCEVANAALPEGSRVLFVGESRYYPCRVPFEYWNPHFAHPFERLRPGVAPERLWAEYVRERGITHVIYSPSEVRRLFEMSPALAARLDRWLRNATKLLVVRGPEAMPCYLLELKPEALHPPATGANGSR